MQCLMTVNIKDVVENHLCMGCGTCVAVCSRSAISMVETPGGLLVAEVNYSHCDYCGLCAKVCPGSHLEKGLVSSDADPFKGNVIGAYCGQAADVNLLKNGQSGGIVTALLCHLLDSGYISRAIVTQMPEDGSLRPRSIVTADRGEIRKSQGSKYCPVALGAVAQEGLGRMGGETAVVGLPCHIHGLANVQSRLAGPAPLRVGLVCDRMLAFGAIDCLVDKANVSRQDVALFQFRSKKFNGWPGDVYIRARDGKEYCVPNRHRTSIKDVYTPVRCRLCFDKMNVLSDLVVGDAWGVREDRRGCSVVMVRTDRGEDAISSARKAGALELEDVNVEEIFKGQAVEKKRRDWTSFVAVWTDSGRSAPDFNIDKRWYANIAGVTLRPYRNKISWAMRLASMASNAHVLKAAKQKVRFHGIRASLSVRGLKRLVRRTLRLLRTSRDDKPADSY